MVLSLQEFAARLAEPAALAEGAGAAGGVVAVVDLGSPRPGRPDPPLRRTWRTVPGVIIGVGEAEPPAAAGPWAELTDVVVGAAEVDELRSAIGARPRAAAALALLLRSAPASMEDGLVAESATYSMLQCGPEFAQWLAGRPPVRAGAGADAGSGPPVLVGREDDRLTVTLARPGRHNALDTALRDALAEALAVGLADPTVTVILRGDGPSFCSGGDLAQFGTAPDPATAHLVRLTRSPAALAARLGPRLEAHVHGACIGAGIELAAFAGRVVARPDTFFALPELGLGLIPGSGGTVSLPRRIGRHRTAWLALTGRRIDAPRALAWGLVDEMA